MPGIGTFEERGRHDIPARMAFEDLPVHQGFPCLPRSREVSLIALCAGQIEQWTHSDGRIQRIAHGYGARGLFKPWREVAPGLFLHENPCDRRAHLSGMGGCAAHDLCRCPVHIGIGKDQGWRFPAQFQRETLQRGGRARHDRLTRGA